MSHSSSRIGLDEELRGYYKVVTGYRRRTLVKAV